jgi:hypothetical protein
MIYFDLLSNYFDRRRARREKEFGVNGCEKKSETSLEVPKIPELPQHGEIVAIRRTPGIR